ncbi:MAG: hypothetical protein ACI86S_000023 [Paracoccaceae bacterium]
MRRWLLFVLFTLLGGAVCAQDTGVRSGEHETFSRLVVPVPIDAEWSLDRAADSYVLTVDGQAERYELGSVFARIPRTRISQVATGPAAGTLTLSLACEVCHADAFLWRPDRLVIDIIDGPAPSGSEFEGSNSEPVGQGELTSPPVVLPLTGNALDEFDTPTGEPFAMESQAIDVSAAQQALIESLARASSQGLLDIVQDDFSRAITQAETSSEVPVAVQSPPADPGHPLTPGRTPTGRPGISLRTSYDQAFPHVIAATLSDQGETCLEAAQFDLTSWSHTEQFNLDVGMQRTLLTEEFDRIPPTAPEALARSYIYYGFGREALQALSLDGVRSKSREILAEMAAVVDGDTVPDGLLSAQLGCVGPGALWAVLAVETLIEQSVGVDRNAVLLAHRGLPEGLRGHLGAQLATRFLEVDDTETSTLILQAVQGSVTGESPAVDRAMADLALRGGHIDAAFDQLAEARESNGRPTPETLIELVNLALQQERALDQDVIDLIAAVQFEFRGQAISTELGALLARALAQQGLIAQAIKVTSPLADSMKDSDFTALQSEVFGRATEVLPDAAFLHLAFDDFPTDINDEAQNAAAARLLTLGFPDRAGQLLLGDAGQDDMRERRYLRASIALALGQPEDALREIAGMTDPRASRLRAGALIARGDLGGAVAADRASLGEDGPDQNLAWRAGAWARLSESEDPLLRDISQRMLGDTIVTAPASPLAQREFLLSKSSETRDLIQNLLERFPVETGETVSPIN